MAGAEVCLFIETKGRFGRSRMENVAAAVRDLSVTGALITAKGEVDLVVGQLLRFSMQGEEGRASIRHISPTVDGVTLIGVSFSSLSPTLEQAIYDGIAKVRSDGSIERHWELNR